MKQATQLRFTGAVIRGGRGTVYKGGFSYKAYILYKCLRVVFKPEELVNRNCAGTQGEGALDAVKVNVVSKCCEEVCS